MINVGLLMLLVALAVLVALQPWGHLLPHPFQVAALAVSAVFLLLYGVAGWIGALLMVTGAIATPERIGEEPARWALLMWEPWMIFGGVLVGLAAVACQRRWLPGTA